MPFRERLQSEEKTAGVSPTASARDPHRDINRRITLHGKSSGIGKEGNESFVAFGRRIRCYLDREAFGEGEREALRTALAADGMVSVSGFSAGLRGDVLIMRDCSARAVVADDKK